MKWINKWREEKAPPHSRKSINKYKRLIVVENHQLAIINQARNIKGC